MEQFCPGRDKRLVLELMAKSRERVVLTLFQNYRFVHLSHFHGGILHALILIQCRYDTCATVAPPRGAPAAFPWPPPSWLGQCNAAQLAA
jgi:hypothetical protein